MCFYVASIIHFCLILFYFIPFFFVSDLSYSIHSLNYFLHPLHFVLFFILLIWFLSSFFVLHSFLHSHSINHHSYSHSLLHFSCSHSSFSPSFLFLLSSSPIALQELSGTRKGRSKVLEAAGAVVNKEEIKDWDSIR